MICEYCKKTLSSKSNLNYHQQNNKTCLAIQQRESDNEIKIALVSCEFCNDFFSEQNLLRHLKKCKIQPITEKFKKEKDIEIDQIKKEKDIEINKLKEKINQLTLEIVSLKTENNIFSRGHEEIFNLARQPKTTKNNNNNNITLKNNFFNDTEKVKEIINSKLDRFDIAAGQKGIAQFTAKNLLKNEDGLLNYVCTDPSRGIFNLIDENGENEKDVKASKLTNLLFESGLKNKTVDIGEALWTKEDGSHDGEKFRMYQEPIYEIRTMMSDNSKFRNELACLTTR